MKISFDSNIIVILENEIPKKKKLIEFVKFPEKPSLINMSTKYE